MIKYRSESESESFYFKNEIQISKQNCCKGNNFSNQISGNGNDVFFRFFQFIRWRSNQDPF